MTRWIGLVAVVVGLSACAQPQPPAPAPPPPPSLTAGWTTTQGMDAPESALLDVSAGAIYVSIVNGAPDARDGNGRIAKLGLDGSVTAGSWATGLNAPKGLRLCAGTLWAADLDEIVGVNVASGQISSRVRAEGAKFLNDVACGPDGTVYVSDMLASKILAVKDGKVSTFAEGETLEYPNGLLVDGGRLIVAGWGKPNADFTTKVPGRLFALDLATKQKTLITEKPIGNLDGLESDGKGGYVVSDWISGEIWQVSATGETRSLRKFAAGAADLAFSPAGNILVLPHMSENKVAAYDLSDTIR